MKNRVYKVFLVAATIVILAFGFAQLKTDNVEAALGNQGIPVRCSLSNAGVNAGESDFMVCRTPVSPVFTEYQRVPSGYYFIVTDILVTPLYAGTDPVSTDITLYDFYDGLSYEYYRFRGVGAESFGEHFNMPLLVLPAEHSLHVSGKITNTGFVDVRVTGMLVTNATYVPAIFSNP